MPKRVTFPDLYGAVEKTANELPDRDQLTFAKDIGNVISKHAGGKAGNVGADYIEMWSFGKKPWWKKIFPFF